MWAASLCLRVPRTYYAFTWLFYTRGHCQVAITMGHFLSWLMQMGTTVKLVFGSITVILCGKHQHSQHGVNHLSSLITNKIGSFSSERPNFFLACSRVLPQVALARACWSRGHNDVFPGWSFFYGPQIRISFSLPAARDFVLRSEQAKEHNLWSLCVSAVGKVSWRPKDSFSAFH